MERYKIFGKNLLNPFIFVLLWQSCLSHGLSKQNNFILELILLGCIPIIVYLVYLLKQIPWKKDNWFAWVFLAYSICSWGAYLLRFHNLSLFKNGMFLLILFGIVILLLLSLLGEHFQIKNKKNEEINMLIPFLWLLLFNFIQCTDFFE